MSKKANKNEVPPQAGDRPTQRGFVYVRKADNGLVKIGRSVKWKSRIQDLNTALPYVLQVLFVFECALRVEPYLHRKFKAQRVRGEWFNLSDDLIDEIPSRVAEADPESGRYLSGEQALQQESELPEWLVRGLRRVEAKGSLSMFDVILYRDTVTIEFDVQAKIKALLALARYHQIPAERIYQAITEGI